MIISASRRTDIPAFYGDWLVRRLAEKTVLVRNPLNRGIISRLPLDPAGVECIVFWTKDPRNFMPCLKQIDDMGYRYYFQFTLTPYDSSIEQNINKDAAVESFIRLSEYAGKEKVIWRYDPVFLSPRHSVSYHQENYEALCQKLCHYTTKNVISFIDTYSFLKKDFAEYGIQSPSAEAMDTLLGSFAKTAKACNIDVSTCCEGADPAKYGIQHNKCIDDELIQKLFGITVPYKKDPAQRHNCGCTVSRDIGAYHTCGHHCVYCYARRGPVPGAYDPGSPLLCDTLSDDEFRLRGVDKAQG